MYVELSLDRRVSAGDVSEKGNQLLQILQSEKMGRMQCINL